MGRQSNKKRRAASAQTAREKAAAARAIQQREEQRRRAIRILAAVVVVVLVGAGIAFAVLNHNSGSNISDRAAASPSVVKAVTSVSDATLRKIDDGHVATLPVAVTGNEPPLTAKGKPELLYIGAEFCPYCAVERWSLAEALSKFGTLSKVGEVHSAVDDGNYASLDFYKSAYTSKYLTFTPVEAEDRNQKALQKPSSAQNALWSKLSNGGEGFPFIDFGNKLDLAGNAPLDPTVLGTSTQQQIASQLDDPSSKIAQTIGGGANDDIASICAMTNNQPATVCNTPTISALETKLTG
ncbi:MAG TPA: DUF929 family protein [Mycobacteriales bacterium]|jgi:hypothetical protein|nr:DUF929 family protein [Mycobacteriales bacterium]